MRKKTNYVVNEEATQEDKVNEPSFAYPLNSPAIAQKGYSYQQFSMLAKQLPFSLKEWALLLHLSERTLQRYAQNNSAFEGIYKDKLLHIEELFQTGISTFATAEALVKWLKKDKTVFGQVLNFSSLQTSQGIQSHIEEIGRIQMGVYI